MEKERLIIIKKRKGGYVLRCEKYRTPQLIIQGKIEGRKKVDHKQMACLWNINKWTDISNTGELYHASKSRALKKSRQYINLYRAFQEEGRH